MGACAAWLIEDTDTGARMSALRRLVRDDLVWEVFAVKPVTEALPPDEPPGGVERRARPRLSVREALRNGWLCFESAHGRRRLVPIPKEWETMSDAALRDLLESAVPVPTLPAPVARPAPRQA